MVQVAHLHQADIIQDNRAAQVLPVHQVLPVNQALEEDIILDNPDLRALLEDQVRAKF